LQLRIAVTIELADDEFERADPIIAVRTAFADLEKALTAADISYTVTRAPVDNQGPEFVAPKPAKLRQPRGPNKRTLAKAVASAHPSTNGEQPAA
jgi:hypothetical protein